MYQALLTRRYLTHKIMPWLAMLAVTLCAALVLITWSIMGGFLVMLLDIGRRMEGDVTIKWPTVGFAHYEDLIKRLEADELVAAAAPVIQTFGMLNLPDDRVLAVSIRGVDERYAKVTEYAQSLWWKPLKEPLPKDAAQRDPRLDAKWPDQFEARLAGDRGLKPLQRGAVRSWQRMYDDGLRLAVSDPVSGEARPAAVLGIELSGFSKRNANGEGWYEPAEAFGTRRMDGRSVWQGGLITAHSVTINVLPLDRKGRSINVVSRRLPVANEFRTGFYEADKNIVLMNLGELQRMLKMEEAEKLEETKGDPYAVEGSGAAERTPESKRIGIDPARVTAVYVKARPGVSVPRMRETAERIWTEFAAAHPGEVPPIETMRRGNISTFEMDQATFVGAVKQETALVLGLLTFLSMVCIVLILTIFWSMVSNKTRDIGVLRAVGCSKQGVAWLWLRYGVAIGVVGAAGGLLLGWAIVHNINPIHEWLGHAFNVSLWDPKVRYFTDIPNRVEWSKAGIVVAGAVVFSLLGALIPAVKAALMDPVKALRFE